MKKYILFLAALCITICMSAADLTGKRFYVNPGHGSFGPNDRPMATIPFPNLSSTGMPDTCGFYESNTNLWKCMYLGEKLKAAGATVIYSRTECGPWPYAKVDGQYPDYTSDNYKAHPDYEKYNRALSEICEEVEANNIDFFISVHSNAASEGATSNYPLYLYRGATGSPEVANSDKMAQKSWPYRNAIMLSGIDPSSHYQTSTNIQGDWSFYGSHSISTRSNGQKYDGYLGALKHGAAGFLVEGYFHTYQPARHRALNHDYCHQEGLAYYRGIIDYYGADKETKGYVMGTVKDLHNKMSNPLFQYAPKTNDQWVPCNGAEVKLYKGTELVSTYTVDNNYNGIFVFENLVPGDDYKLDATCEGYYPLDKSYQVNFSVKANETSYQMIFLSDTSYQAPTVFYKNYPDPAQPAYLGLPSSFEMQQSFVGRKMAEALDGLTVRRTLYRDGLIYVLAVNEQKEPTLIAVDANTQVVTYTLPTDFCSVTSADGMKLSDISFTADGYLIGCNYEAVTFEPSNNWNIYKWELDATGWHGALWFNNTNNETAGNYNNAMVGATFAYSGTLADGIIAATSQTTGSSTAIRYCIYTIADGNYAGALRNQPDGVTAIEYGAELQMVVSPRDSASFILSSPLKNPVEWKIVNTTKSAPEIKGSLPFHSLVANYFMYAGRALMATPDENETGLTNGVALYDITDGLAKANRIATTNTTIDAFPDTYKAAFGAVNGSDLTLYLTEDNAISKFTTVGVPQPAVPAMVAYNLNSTLNGSDYSVSFYANADAQAAAIVFFDAEGKEAGRLPLTNVKKGDNTFTISNTLLPGSEGTMYTWGIELTGEAISNFGLIYSDNSLIASGTSRLFNAVNTDPESPYFGHMYIFHRAGSSSSSLKGNSGLFDFDYTYRQLNAERYNGGETFGNPQRLTLSSEGYIYMSDWSDPHSGIFVADPSDLTQPFTQFFAGTRNSSGVFNNSGVYTGSSTPGIFIYGKGADSKLFVYNEDASGTLPANGMVVYNIGQPDGSILRAWDKAPDQVWQLTGQGNTEGNPWGTSHGFFVGQSRTLGQNNASATSLKFYDYNGNELFSSASEEWIEVIDGSNGAGYAVSPDESMLVLNDGSTNFMVFDITWDGDKPLLTPRYSFKHGITVIRQMNWDYAGNLVCTGDNGIFVYSMPTDYNVTLVPARKALTMIHGQSIAVTGVSFTAESVELEKGTTANVAELVQIAPADASNKFVAWSSKDETIATVDANGVITGVSLGETKVIVTTVDGGFTAELTVTVKPISVKSIRIISGTDGKMTINMGSNYSIAYEILPVDAANKNATWTSSDDAIVSIQGPALIIGNAPGTATITATTEDGGFTATLEVTVEGETSLRDINVDADVQKMIINGQLIIIRDGIRYNAQGTVIQ